MTYPFFNKDNPTTAQTLAAVGTSIRENTVALRDAIVWGFVPTSSSTVAQAGGTAGEPTEITTLAGGAERLFTTLSWSLGYISSMIFKYSATSSGGTTDTLVTASFGYSAGDLTSVSNVGMGPFAKLIPVIGKYKDIRAAFDTHNSTTAGTGVHGTNSLALQSSTAVSITGGSIVNTTIGSSTALNGVVNAKYVREAAYFYGTLIGGATMSVNLASGGWGEIQITGSSSVSPANIDTSTSDLPGTTALFQVVGIMINIPAGAGLQYLNWLGYSFIGLAQPELTENKSHVFYILQRSNGVGGVFKLVQYAGVLA